MIVATPNADIITLARGRDNGYIKCATGVFKGEYRNNHNTEVVSNISTALPSPDKRRPTVMIAGHGSPGIILTGNGDRRGNSSQYIARANRVKWSRTFKNLKDKLYHVKLLACSTGADNVGADVLYHMATLLNCVVMSPTHLVWCGRGKIWLDRRAKWQVAFPGVRPTPIPHVKNVVLNEPEFIRLKTESGYVVVPFDQIRRLEFTLMMPRTANSMESVSIPYEGDDALEIMRLVDAENPFEPGGSPAAIERGFVAIHYKDSDTTEELQRSFRIFTDGLLQDNSYPEVYYRCDTEFSNGFIS